VLRDAEHVAVVPLDELLKSADVTSLRSLYQRKLFAYWLTYFWLDGTHSQSDARYFTQKGRGKSVILLGN
jgi:hypothetical protein